MAPSKKTKSDHRVTSSNLLKALKKNKAVQPMKKKALTPKKNKEILSEDVVSEPVRRKAVTPKKNKACVSEPVKKKARTPEKNKEVDSVKKKAISSKLKSQLSKKRKRVEEPVPSNDQHGLRLLKRGPVSMHRIVRRKMTGVKLTVLFNAKGVPYGSAATEMQSYLGVLARTKVPIWYDSWLRVPKERKEKIWNCVEVKNCISLSNCLFFSVNSNCLLR